MKKGSKILVLLLFTLLMMGCSNSKKKDDSKFKQKQYNLIKGLNQSQQGKYSKAIEFLLISYSIDSKDTMVLRELAYNYWQAGDIKNAERFYLEFLKINPNDSLVRFNLGTIYYNNEEYDKSLKLLEATNQEIITNDIIALVGYNYFGLKNYEKSYEILKSISTKKTGDLYFSKVYGEVLLQTKRLGELHPYITKLYEANTNNPEVVYIYGKHLAFNLGKYTEAVEVYKKYIIDNGANKVINLEAAKMCIELKNYILAKQFLDLISEQEKYKKNYLEVALEVYKGLNDYTKVNEINAILNRLN